MAKLGKLLFRRAFTENPIMSNRSSPNSDSQGGKKISSREEAIPEMKCKVHEQEELCSRIECYENSPESAFCLPSTTHHWLICQNHSGPRRFLVQADAREHDIGGLDSRQMIYLPPGTRTQWDFSSAVGSTHFLIPDKLLMQALSNDRDFAATQERGPLLGTAMPRLSRLILAHQRQLKMEGDLSKMALSEFTLEVSEALARELSGQGVAQRLPTSSREKLGAQALKILEEFMWDNLERNISLAELAQLVHHSPSHFSRIFKQETGTTPHQALLRMRIQRARTLLPQSKTLTEVAYRTGFSDQAHFTRVFKTQTGFTPKQFRKATA